MSDTQLLFRSPPPVTPADVAPVTDARALLVTLNELATEFDQRGLGCPRLAAGDECLRKHVTSVQVLSIDSGQLAPRARHRAALDDLLWRRCIEQHDAAAIAAAARPATPTADLATPAMPTPPRAAPSSWAVPSVAVLDTAGPVCTPGSLLQKLDELVLCFEASNASFRRVTDDDGVREQLAELRRDAAPGTSSHNL